jgi:hypothetical protein
MTMSSRTTLVRRVSRPQASAKPKSVGGAAAVARLLFPHGDGVQDDRHDGGALDGLNEPARRVVLEQGAEDERAGDHADEQHDIHEADDLRLILFGHQVGRERQPHGLYDMDAGADQQERQGRRTQADPSRRIHRLAVAGQNQKRERHDREAPELQHRALKDVGQPPQTESGFVIV